MSEKWIIVIISAVMVGLLSLFIMTGFNAKSRHLSVEQEKSVQSACEAAADTMCKNMDGKGISDKDLQDIRISFWRAYCKSRGYGTFETGELLQGQKEISLENFAVYVDDAAKYEIACVIYVDYDGFYVEYTRLGKESFNGRTQDNYAMFVTEKQAFAKDYGTCRLQYRLDSFVYAQKNGLAGTVSGGFDEVYEELGMPSELSFMQDYENYMAEHNEVIREAIENTVNYYINLHNDTNNRRKIHYTFAIPNDATGFGRMMQNPCAIAFSQGAQNASANVFALAAASIERETLYDEYILITPDGSRDKFYTVKGTAHDLEKSGTMYDLAEDGAMPDQYISAGGY